MDWLHTSFVDTNEASSFISFHFMKENLIQVVEPISNICFA